MISVASMWKAFSRYVKEPLERTISKHKREPLENDSQNKQKCLLKGGCIVPSFIRSSVNKSFYNRHILNRNDEKCFEENRSEDTFRNSSKCRYYHSWLEAAGLSGTLAFGGYIFCQNFFRKRTELNDLYQFRKIRNQYRYNRIKRYLLRYSLQAQPAIKTEATPFLVSDSDSLRIDSDGQDLTLYGSQTANEAINEAATPFLVSNSDSLQIDSNGQNHTFYGPQTADEAINEAASELLNAHNGVLAEMENRTGLKFMQYKRYRKAIKHFATAAALRHPSAMFNLAQCYELGLGTKQDFKKAADYYKVASENGHATAMYNLGVFYAHGWGGLSSNAKEAQKWIEKAAELGQPDAKAALDLRYVKPPKLDDNDCPSLSCNCNSSHCDNSKEPFETNNIAYIIDTLKNKVIDQTSDAAYTTPQRLRYDSYSSTSRSSILSSELDYDQQSLENFAGICYENGFGVKQNAHKASQLYSQSAYHGNSVALYNLASLYETTIPEEDSYQAPLIYQLYKMAAKQGHHYAKEKVNTLEIYHTLGILTDFLTANKIHSTKSAFVKFT